MPVIPLESCWETSVPLSLIVEEEVLQSKLIAFYDLDVSELYDEVRGYRVSQVGAIRGGLEPLQAAWPFDVVQQGYQIKFRRRPNTSVVTIPAEHLDARSGDTPGVEITIDRDMDSQLPREVAVTYIDVNREYE